MPCSDSSSSIALKFDAEERFVSFDFAKITCGREITAKTGYSTYCVGRTLPEILAIPYAQAATELKLQDEEGQFILYMEWDVLRSALAEYLGSDDEFIDRGRCKVTSIDYLEREVEVALVVLPPKELPKILPCSLAERKENK